ncbi:ceramidase domain-containing protein [Cellulosimicrobium cellulans]|uniref:Ceramidase n=1 Tax=Cellulosimicrobium cellulans F16 TaxID=1350482 RepID=A0A0M0F360_CELCE|nr:ceramidase domain-containing protein [Cellulosimicrobium cellulans]KON71611.1 hypothetical protein M768_18780 [Cellulosimicrobium cellulans F16]
MDDCEYAGTAPFAEPLSTVTSLAFVVAGVAILVGARQAARRPDGTSPVAPRVTMGVLAVLVGFGSAVQHGPAPSWNPVAHDPPLFGALALVTADAVSDLTGRRLRTWWWLAPTLVDVAIAATAPQASTYYQWAVSVTAVGTSALRAWYRPAVRRRLVVTIALLAAGGAVSTFTRTGWPCDTAGWFGVEPQGHAIWHVLAATAMWVVAPTLGRRPAT